MDKSISSPQRLDTLIKQAREKLAAAKIDNPALDARLLAQYAFDLSHEDVIIKGSSSIENLEQISEFSDAVSRRIDGEPVSKIIGEKEFFGRLFMTSPDVLDPRPDTEILVEKALGIISSKESPHILDLGCGSGCVIISLLCEHPKARAVAVDISDKALKVARQNAFIHGVIDRLSFVQGGWDSANAIAENTPFDLVVSNPPYIATDVVMTLEKEVLKYDPILALDGGSDGMDAYKNIFAQLNSLLHPQGRAAFEIGYDQGDAIKRLAESSRFEEIGLYEDLSGKPRVFVISTGKT